MFRCFFYIPNIVTTVSFKQTNNCCTNYILSSIQMAVQRNMDMMTIMNRTGDLSTAWKQFVHNIYKKTDKVNGA